MKEDDVVFVPPDQDRYEHKKGIVLNNLIFHYLEHHNNKRSFQNLVNSKAGIFDKISSTISEEAKRISQKELEEKLQVIAN